MTAPTSFRRGKPEASIGRQRTDVAMPGVGRGNNPASRLNKARGATHPRATHGHTFGRTTTREFNSWLAMRQRCTDPKCEKWPRYGGRGIKVCDRWSNSFEAFLADMGARPDSKTLDRYPDRDGNYEPGNCRWATAKEQAANREPGLFNAQARKTHCPSGHPYSGSNLRVTAEGGRKCRECEHLRSLAKRRNPV